MDRPFYQSFLRLLTAAEAYAGILILRVEATLAV